MTRISLNTIKQLLCSTCCSSTLHFASTTPLIAVCAAEPLHLEHHCFIASAKRSFVETTYVWQIYSVHNCYKTLT